MKIIDDKELTKSQRRNKRKKLKAAHMKRELEEAKQARDDAQAQIEGMAAELPPDSDNVDMVDGNGNPVIPPLVDEHGNPL